MEEFIVILRAFSFKHFCEILLSYSELVFFHGVKQKLIKAYVAIGINGL